MLSLPIVYQIAPPNNRLVSYRIVSLHNRSRQGSRAATVQLPTRECGECGHSDGDISADVGRCRTMSVVTTGREGQSGWR